VKSSDSEAGKFPSSCDFIAFQVCLVLEQV
jgi:hypothetical protein